MKENLNQKINFNNNHLMHDIQHIVCGDDKIDVEKQLIKLFATITGEKDVVLRTQLEGKINSMQYVTLIVELEKTFGIEFEDDKLSMIGFETLGDIFEYLKNM